MLYTDDIELASRAVRRRPGLQVLFVSGYVKEAAWNPTVRPGTLIPKPCRADDLKREVNAPLVGSG